jgi:2-dehydro-3-deoxyphosphogluconate aldolase/(4S)-4-hydroxy-2-oxoglutarate aldolase
VTIDQVMRMAPVIPVLVVKDVAHGLPVAQALVKGGLPVLEVTLRTEAALDVIREMSKVAGSFVGAGTVLNEKQLDQAIEAGAKFIVSPGLTTPLAEAAIERGIPFLPGIATAADIMRGLDLGLDRFKFFPAETSGGIKALKALAAPFYQCRFCPTGGITVETAPDWLAVDPVLCVGGSWVVPAGEPDPAEIEARARAAAALGK